MVPLSEKIRPKKLSEMFGQSDAICYIKQVIQNKKPLSILLFGPPGCGKTTLAKIYMESFSLPFAYLSAVFNSVSELKRMIKEGKESPLFQRQTLIFVDEIHRLNRAQQDIFLPLLEDGSIILVGATTENPSFVLNNALLSRMRTLKLEALQKESLDAIIDRYLSKNPPLSLDDQKKKQLIDLSQGDARYLLNMLENLEQKLPLEKKAALYDKGQDSHYQLISALHKAIRSSDVNGALYWFARMVDGGEDLKYIGRRLLRIASEDIGLADPNALNIALSGLKAYKLVGSPEADLMLAQVVVYLALSPKSISLYKAYKKAAQEAKKTGHLPPPMEVINAPTQWMKEMGYGKNYRYDPEEPSKISGQDYFPKEVEERDFYHPEEIGFEREMKKRLAYFQKLREHSSQS